MATIKVMGKAKVKPSTKWIYAGHTLKLLEKREPTRYEMDFGAEYKLCLKGTEFEQRYKSSPYTFIHAKDLEIISEETTEALEDALIDEVIGHIKEDIAVGDVSAIFELLRFCPVKHLIQYLPEEKWKLFGDLEN